jgi:hypothetical protein
MFDGSSLPDDWFSAHCDNRAADRAAIRYALVMTAAVVALTLAAVVTLDSLFPAAFEVDIGLAFPFPC